MSEAKTLKKRFRVEDEKGFVYNPNQIPPNLNIALQHSVKKINLIYFQGIIFKHLKDNNMPYLEYFFCIQMLDFYFFLFTLVLRLIL